MRVWIACGLLAALMLAGCAEELPQGETDEEVQGHQDDLAGSTTGLTGALRATVADLNVTQGEPFNVTLAYEGNATDASGLAWEIRFQPAQASQGNASANGTAEGNGTDAGPVYNGTGLPAEVTVALQTVGELVMTGTASDGNGTLEMEPLRFVVAEAVQQVVEEDPCADAVVQDPIETSGLVGPGAANQGYAADNPFELLPCHKKMTIDVSTTTADIIIRLIFPDGSHVDYDSAFIGGDTFDYDHGGYMPAGEYNAQLRQYATVADEYQMTITFA